MSSISTCTVPSPVARASTRQILCPDNRPCRAALPAAQAPAFGAPAQQSAPAFGGLGTAPSFGNTPAFGASTTPAFGAPAATPAFGGFGTAASTPAFGQAAAAPANPFGAAPTTGFGATAPAFGASTATTTTGFGAPAAAPAFGECAVQRLVGPAAQCFRVRCCAGKYCVWSFSPASGKAVPWGRYFV